MSLIKSKKYRDTGAIGALLDEYEKALDELAIVIADVSNENLIRIVDGDTHNPDCKSIQSILTHVIRSGYCYVVEIRKSFGEDITLPERTLFYSVDQYKAELNEMLIYNEQLFKEYPDLKLEELNTEKKMLVSWGQRYDAEQLLEHAIVHILKHRRQIEKFLITLELNKDSSS